jgi:hypothetical protein
MEATAIQHTSVKERTGWAARWTQAGDKGEQRMVRISELLIDTAYQGPPSESVVRAIAKDFAWRGFGVVVVMQRAGGQLYLVDGQHRVEAVRRRHDTEWVPAIVFRSTGVQQESMAYIALNEHRRGKTSLRKYNAHLVAGLSPEVDVEKWLQINGFSVGSHSDTVGMIAFPTHLVRSWVFGQEACREALLVQREITGGLEMDHYIHNGLWWLERNEIATRPHVKKLLDMGGREAITRTINQTAIAGGFAGKSIPVCGAGILKLINHRRQNRILVNALEDRGE